MNCFTSLFVMVNTALCPFHNPGIASIHLTPWSRVFIFYFFFVALSSLSASFNSPLIVEGEGSLLSVPGSLLVQTNPLHIF
jgi:hypothetical protein